MCLEKSGTRNSKDVLYIARCMTGSYVREEPLLDLKTSTFMTLMLIQHNPI